MEDQKVNLLPSQRVDGVLSSYDASLYEKTQLNVQQLPEPSSFHQHQLKQLASTALLIENERPQRVDYLDSITHKLALTESVASVPTKN